MVLRISVVFVTLSLALSLSGCFTDRKPAASPDAEYSDEQEYANTPTAGPGSESSSGYYGVGNTEKPQHQPAQPSQGGHQPY